MQSVTKLLLPPVLMIGAASLALLSSTRVAGADATSTDADVAPRCATRLSIAMIGEAASASLLTSTTPQSAADDLVKDSRFIERFSRFINSQFNVTPGATPAEDAPYYLAKYVLENGKPWSDMFLGGYDVAPSNPQQATSEATVTQSADGLGYFRSRAWMVRYAGNEPAGMRIVAANRIMWNTIGLTLVATTNAPDADVSATGRSAAQCRGCHMDKWFALDKVSVVLGTRKGTGNTVTFDPPTAGPQTILGGATVSNDKELVQALVSNESFNVNVCRLAFKYLYGRAEYSCDGPVFDKCMTAFKADKRIQSAVTAVAKDPSFCE